MCAPHVPTPAGRADSAGELPPGAAGGEDDGSRGTIGPKLRQGLDPRPERRRTRGSREPGTGQPERTADDGGEAMTAAIRSIGRVTAARAAGAKVLFRAGVEPAEGG